MTYTYGTKKVIIENNKVIYSDTELCQVGQSPNLKVLKACGWNKAKSPKINYINSDNGAYRFNR